MLNLEEVKEYLFPDDRVMGHTTEEFTESVKKGHSKTNGVREQTSN